MANTYFFTFEKWITIDRKNGFAGSGENIQQMQADRIEKAIKKVDNRLDRLEFTFKDLPASLREWEKHLVHTGDFQGTHYFNSIGNISPSFAEESFKKHGYNIKILKSA